MESIILSRRDFRESDQIISLYTKEKGKMELLARGVKKILSKNTAHLEPCSYVQADVVPGKEIDHLIRVQPINFFSSIRQSLSKSLAVSFAISLTDSLVHVHEPDQRIFLLLKNWLSFLNRNNLFSPLLIDSYVMKLFSLLGFTPILEYCVVCERKKVEIIKEDLFGSVTVQERMPGFYFAGGGLVCSRCRMQKKMIGEEILSIGIKELSDLDIIMRADWNLIVNTQLSDREYHSVHHLVYRFTIFHSERKISDWSKIMPRNTIN